jgi:hypothetical protein
VLAISQAIKALQSKVITAFAHSVSIFSVTAHVLTVVLVTTYNQFQYAVSVGVSVMVLVSAQAAVQDINVQLCILAAISLGITTRGFQVSKSVHAILCAESANLVLPVTESLAFGVVVQVSISSH